jgi:ATP-binding cassette subfamily B protein
MLAGILIVLWIENWRFGLAFLTATALASGLYALVIRIPPRYWAQERAAMAAFLGFVEERLAGAEDIRANGAVPYVMRTLGPHLQRLLERSRRAWVTSLVLNVSWQTYRALGFAAAFGVGWWLHTRSGMSLGTVYLAIWYFGLAIWPVMALTDRFEDLQKASASIARIRQMLAERSALPEPVAARSLPGGPLAVECAGVSFAYGSAPTLADVGAVILSAAKNPPTAPTLSDVTFELPAGTTLGLLGRTGSGKSTLSRLLFRFYDPTTGSVRLSGIDLRDLSLAELRSRVALVTQEVQLFRATVRDNLTFFTPGVSDDRVLATLRDLGLDPWLARLSDGLDTVLTPSGAAESDDPARVGGGLSAGEAQLLAFARVFLRDPGLVILDEASSRLDPATEALIDRAVSRLLAGRTAIVIAHRLATVRQVDDVLILEGGRIAEHGERAALECDPASHFSRLLSAAGLRSEVLV